MISDDIIVRASNPGQFESDSESVWSWDCTTGAIYHSGNVAINTDRASEALTVNGNIQLTGQVINWSGRLKKLAFTYMYVQRKNKIKRLLPSLKATSSLKQK